MGWIDVAEDRDRWRAHEKFSSSEKKSTHEQIQGEKYDYCFFFSTAVALCKKNLYLQDRQLITPSTKMP